MHVLDSSRLSAQLYNQAEVCARGRVKFQTLGEALSYYNHHNPARAKYRSSIEPEPKNNKYFDDFSGESPSDVFASIAWGIKRVLERLDFTRALVWNLRNLGDTEHQWAVEDIAAYVDKHPREVWRWLDAIDDDLARELIRREILEDDSAKT